MHHAYTDAVPHRLISSVESPLALLHDLGQLQADHLEVVGWSLWFDAAAFYEHHIALLSRLLRSAARARVPEVPCPSEATSLLLPAAGAAPAAVDFRPGARRGLGPEPGHRGQRRPLDV